MDPKSMKDMGTLDGELAAELSLETRLQIAGEINRLKAGDSNGKNRLVGTVISGVDEEHLHALIRSTLERVHARGGFLRHIPLFEERSEFIRRQIQSHKEELVTLHSEIQERAKLLQQYSPTGDHTRAARGKDGSGEDAGNGDREEERERDALSLRAELRFAASRSRRIMEEIVSLAENFAKCVDTLVRLSQAAASRDLARVEAVESPAEPIAKGSESRMVAPEAGYRRRTSTPYREN
jgi:hypothetical protein